MKKFSFLLAACSTATLLNAAVPAPLADVTFTGGDLKALSWQRRKENRSFPAPGGQCIPGILSDS